MCIYMVFFFGRRLQTSAYLRDSLIDGAKQQELRTLLQELHERAREGPLDPRYPPPDGYGTTRRLWEANHYGEGKAPSSSWVTSNESPAEKEERLERSRQQEQRQLEL